MSTEVKNSSGRDVVRKIAEQFVSQIPFKLRSFDANLGPDDRGQIHQYTSMPTLVTLSQSKFGSVWASSARYMNDSQEFIYGRELFREVLTDYRSGLKSPSRSWMGRITTVVLEELDKLDANDVFCACFSREGDHLGQWRGYGAGGLGCCVSFDYLKLQDLNGLHSWVIYDKQKQAELANLLFVEYLHTVVGPRIRRENMDTMRDWASQELLRMLPALFMLFKHPAFKEEREYRVIYTDDVNSSPVARRGYRLSGALVIPYVELQYLSSVEPPIEMVRLGPGCSEQRNIDSVRRMLSADFRNVRVESSGIPFLPK